MEPKDIYRESLNNSYSEEELEDKELEDKELEEKIKSINEIKDNPLVIVRDMIVDAGAGAAIGKAFGSIIGAAKSKGVVKSLSEGVDDVTKKLAAKIAKKSRKQTSRLNKAMRENSHAAREAVRTGKLGKALQVIINNKILEAKIGPEYVDDIANILSEGTGKSTRAAKKAIDNWLKKHADDTNLLSLIEAKDNTTFAHSTRVGELTKQVALEAGLEEEAAERLSQAAFLHDIGKIATPDRILSSTANAAHNPEIFEWLKAHPNLGYEILEGVDDTAAGIAKGHHPKYDATIVPNRDTEIVTISDIYDAITDLGRKYRGGAVHDKNFALYDPAGIQWNIDKGETTWEYLELLRKLDKKGLLKEYYPVESELTDAFNNLKANFLGDNIRKQYVNDAGNIGALAGGITGEAWGALDAFYDEQMKEWRAKELEKKYMRHLDQGGLEPTSLPSPSEILAEFFPIFRPKSEKLADIGAWYENGYLNEEQIEQVKSTNFRDNAEVTKLWKEIRKTLYK